MNINFEFFKACEDGNIEKAKELLQNGSDINYKYGMSGEEITSLMVASRKGNIEMVKFLIENGADHSHYLYYEND